MTRDDEPLRARFDELRDADERGAPAFHAVLTRSASPASPGVGRRWPLRVALALAAAVIVLAVGLARESRRRDVKLQPLATWRSPTASLLRTTGIELISSSTLASSMLDPITAKSTLRTGRLQ